MPHVKDFLSDNLYMNIATVDGNGQPWNTVVFFAEKDKKLYWFSNIESVHSQNISANEKVFITIYDSTLPEGEGIGLFVLAKASELKKSDEIQKAIAAYNQKAQKYKINNEFVSGDSPNRMYGAEILQTWVNSDGKKNGVFIDVRKEVS